VIAGCGDSVSGWPGDARLVGDPGAAADAGDPADPVHPITPATVCGEPAVLPAGVLLDTGHAYPITFVARSKSRVFTMDAGGATNTYSPTRWRWNLWDAATATQVASGIADGFAIGFTPDVFVVPANGQLELRSSADGQPRGTVAASAATHFGLSSDGSYLWGNSASALSTWTLTGTPIVSRPGNYDGAGIFAGPDELQVVWGPAGQSVIERVATTDGSQAGTVPFKGQFTRWFLDGKHFTTLEAGYTRLYDQTGSQLQVGLDAIDGGVGDLYWRLGFYGTEFFRIGPPDDPVLTINGADPYNIVVSGNILAVTAQRDVELVHLDEKPLHAQVAHSPIIPSASWTFGLDESGNWAAGDLSGQVYVRGNESDPIAAEYLGCGLLYDVVGAPTGQVAVALGAKIHALDATTGQYVGSIELAAQQLGLTDDGKTLFALLQTPLDPGLRELSWPDGKTLATFATYYDPVGKLGQGYTLVDWSFASSQGTLSRTFHGTLGPVYLRQSTGGFPDDTIAALLMLSPSGKRVDADIPVSPDPCMAGGARFYDQSGQFSGSTTLVALGWIDDDHVLTQDWTGQACATAGETRIYDALGNAVATTPQMPKISKMKPVSATRIYAADQNAIYDLGTGAVTWSSPLPLDRVALPADFSMANPGAIAGAKVVFSSDGRLHAESY
jgi:hypothetical protein